jgi:hypothetical protein
MANSVHRFLLRPLRRERRKGLSHRQILAAVATLEDVLAGDEELLARREELTAEFAEGSRGDFTRDHEAAKQWIEFNRLLYKSRRISWARYIFSVSIAVEGVHDENWMRALRETPLKELDTEIQALEEAGEEDSDRYRDLQEQYDAASDTRFVLTFRDLGATDVAEIIARDRAFYEELRERGRRGLHHTGSYETALRDVVDEIYAEALSSAGAQNYRAGVTLLGAALEGLLLMRCIRSPKRPRKIADALPRRLRSRATGDLKTWTFEVLIEVTDRAGWLARMQGRRTEYSPSGLAHSIRTMRNWIHPAREAADRPWEGVFEADYNVAHALYTLVKTAVLQPRSLRRDA